MTLRMKWPKSRLLGAMAGMALFAQPAWASLFDDYMATLHMLTAKNAICTDLGRDKGANCVVSGRDFSFTVSYTGGEAPAFVVSSLSPGNSIKGLVAFAYFSSALGQLGFSDSCFKQSLNSNFIVFEFKRNGYAYECQAIPDVRANTLEQRFTVKLIATSPVAPPAASSLEQATWPGEWKVTSLPDGRLWARVVSHDSGEIEQGSFAAFGIICGRDGRRKIGFDSVDGSKLPVMILEPTLQDPFKLPLIDNEIRGAQATAFLGDLADIESQAKGQGHPDSVILAFSGDEDSGYASLLIWRALPKWCCA